jgi:hypothetical protein
MFLFRARLNQDFAIQAQTGDTESTEVPHFN